jgi:hypothetical protein
MRLQLERQSIRQVSILLLVVKVDYLFCFPTVSGHDKTRHESQVISKNKTGTAEAIGSNKASFLSNK